MPMRPCSGWIRAISPMAMPQLPWMDGMSKRSLQQADGKTWMWGKPSWAELGKWIWGMCRGLMTETLWIVSRSRRGNVQPASCVYRLDSTLDCFFLFEVSNYTCFSKKVGTWLRTLIIPTVDLQILVFLSLHPPFFVCVCTCFAS